MKRVVSIAAVLILMVGGLFWWSGVRHRSGVHLSEQTVISSESGLKPPAGSTNGVAGAAELKRPEDVTPELWGRLLAFRASRLGQNHRIEFYARVMEQDGTPVAGARLKLKLSYVDESLFHSTAFLRMQMGDEIKFTETEAVSDQAGLLEVSGRTGVALYVEDLVCAGYSWQMPPIGGFDYREGKPRAGTTDQEAAFDKTRRYSFVMWKKGETERLVPINCSVSVNAIGTNWYGVNLVKSEAVPVRDADFVFCSIAERDSQDNFRRWFGFGTPSGGLIPNTDPYPYRAPVVGYEQQWEWRYEPNGVHAGKNAYALFKRQFYIMARGKRLAATITWEWPTENSVRITGYANPFGSRNLEPDPEKLITDPEEIRRIDEQTRAK